MLSEAKGRAAVRRPMELKKFCGDLFQKWPQQTPPLAPTKHWVSIMPLDYM